MKNLFSLILLGFTVFTFAQNAPKMKSDFMDFTPEQQAVIHTKKMTLQLDLSATQQKQLLEVNKKSAVQHQNQIKTMKSIKESGAKPTSEERFNRMNSMLDTKLAHQADIKKILNGKQYEEWKKMTKDNMMGVHNKYDRSNKYDHKKGSKANQRRKMN